MDTTQEYKGPAWHTHLYQQLTSDFDAFDLVLSEDYTRIIKPTADKYPSAITEFMAQWDALPTMRASTLVREIARCDSTGLKFILLTLDIDAVPDFRLYPADVWMHNFKLYPKGVVPISSLLGIFDGYAGASNTVHLGRAMDLAWLKDERTRIIVAPNSSIQSSLQLFARLFASVAKTFKSKNANVRAQIMGYAELLRATHAMFRYAHLAQTQDNRAPRVFRLAMPEKSDVVATSTLDDMYRTPIATRLRTRATDTMMLSENDMNVNVPQYSWSDFACDFVAFAPSYTKAAVFQAPSVPDHLYAHIVARHARSYRGKRIHQLRWCDDIQASLLRDLDDATHKDFLTALQGWWPEIIHVCECDDDSNGMYSHNADDHVVMRTAIVQAVVSLLVAQQTSFSMSLQFLLCVLTLDPTHPNTHGRRRLLHDIFVEHALDLRTLLPRLPQELIMDIHRWIRSVICALEIAHDKALQYELHMVHTSRLEEFPIWICAAADIAKDARRHALVDIAHIDDVLNVDHAYPDWQAFMDAYAFENTPRHDDHPDDAIATWTPQHYLAVTTEDSRDFVASLLRDDTLTRVLDFIDDAVDHGRHLIIHCYAGQHRSVGTLMLWLLIRQRWDVRRIFYTMLRLNRIVGIQHTTILWMMQYASEHHITPIPSMVDMACSTYYRSDDSPIQHIFDTARATEAAMTHAYMTHL